MTRWVDGYEYDGFYTDFREFAYYMKGYADKGWRVAEAVHIGEGTLFIILERERFERVKVEDEDVSDS